MSVQLHKPILNSTSVVESFSGISIVTFTLCPTLACIFALKRFVAVSRPKTVKPP